MPRSSYRRTAVTAVATTGLAAVVAGGVAVLSASGQAASAAAPAASSATPTPGTSASPGTGRRSGGSGPRASGPMGGPGADGVVTSVSSSKLTVKAEDGTSTSYVLDSSTTYHAGPAITEKVSDIAVGDRVHVRTTDASSSTKTAADVDEVVPHLGGVVTSVTSDSVVVTDHDGFQRTIVTSATTKYTKDGASSSRSAVVTGARVNAGGAIDADKTSLDASSVDVVTKTATPPAGGPGGGRGPRGMGGTGGTGGTGGVGGVGRPGPGLPGGLPAGGAAPSGTPGGAAPSGAPSGAAPSGTPTTGS